MILPSWQVPIKYILPSNCKGLEGGESTTPNKKVKPVVPQILLEGGEDDEPDVELTEEDMNDPGKESSKRVLKYCQSYWDNLTHLKRGVSIKCPFLNWKTNASRSNWNALS